MNPYILYNEDKNEKFAKSKNIQTAYENGDITTKNEIYEFSILHLNEMIFDTYYNYIIQKILESGKFIYFFYYSKFKGLYQHKFGIFQEIKKNFLEHSYQKYGCRVIQKTLEV